MEDLTVILLNDLKKQAFDLCHELFPQHAQYEGDKIYHIYHAIKLTKFTEDYYTIIDLSKDKPTEVSNKFLLYKMVEQLKYDLSVANKEAEIEAAEEALTESLLDMSGEPNQHEIEVAEEILREANLIEKEIE